MCRPRAVLGHPVAEVPLPVLRLLAVLVLLVVPPAVRLAPQVEQVPVAVLLPLDIKSQLIKQTPREFRGAFVV